MESVSILQVNLGLLIFIAENNLSLRLGIPGTVNELEQHLGFICPDLGLFCSRRPGREDFAFETIQRLL